MEIQDIVPVILDPANKGSIEFYALLGDYIGGFWGTAIGVLTLLVVLITWKQSKKSEYRAKTYQIFTEMLRTHEEIISSIRVNSFSGRDAFVAFLSEFYSIYRMVNDFDAENRWSLDEKIDISYCYMFYGPHIVTAQALNGYDENRLKSVHDLVQKMRHDGKGNKRSFSGHQNRLSHYFRNLFGAYTFIESSKLSSYEKKSLGKVIRTKLSNYEQALLALNTVSHLGREWENAGIFSKHKPIKNIPERFFTFDDDFELNRRFPYINFEWESSNQKITKSWSTTLFGIRFSTVRSINRNL